MAALRRDVTPWHLFKAQNKAGISFNFFLGSIILQLILSVFYESFFFMRLRFPPSGGTNMAAWSQTEVCEKSVNTRGGKSLRKERKVRSVDGELKAALTHLKSICVVIIAIISRILACSGVLITWHPIIPPMCFCSRSMSHRCDVAYLYSGIYKPRNTAFVDSFWRRDGARGRDLETQLDGWEFKLQIHLENIRSESFFRQLECGRTN